MSVLFPEIQIFPEVSIAIGPPPAGNPADGESATPWLFHSTTVPALLSVIQRLSEASMAKYLATLEDESPPPVKFNEIDQS